MKNIVLIGMPGAGKSTIGVILAKTLGMHFVDTDLIIQENENMLLQDIINSGGINKFIAIEEKCILSLDCKETVIATGGSVVYSTKAMEHLKQKGTIIYFKLGIEEIIKRINNIKTRGIVLDKGQSLIDIYNQRVPLYEKYSDITVDCTDKGVEDVIQIIKNEIETKLPS